MRLFFLSLLLTGFTALQAQSITGVAKDDQGAVLSGATVSLLKDSAIVKYTASKKDGTYTFSEVKDGKYRVSITYVGYKPAVSAPVTMAGNDVAVPAFALAKNAGDLNAVTVSVRKPIVEVKADKTILNVENTINAAGSDGLELLRKAPGVTVDKDDNLSVNGKNGVQVYIDGRPTPLSGQDLANYLKTLQSSQIEAIEIITNPSAKYEAAGNAGIINIRLKKNKAFGTNGSVTAGYAIGVFPKYNGSFSLNHRNKAINVYGTYSVFKGLNHNGMSLYRTTADTTFDQNGFVRNDNQSHNLKLGADYTLDKKSSLGVLFTGTMADPKMTNNSTTPIVYAPTKEVTRILVADNKTNLKRSNYNLNLNYNYNGTNGSSLVVNVDNGYYNNDNDQYQPNYYYTPDGKTLTRSIIYQTIAPTKIHINSGKLDFEQNLGGGKFGLGGKVSLVNTDNDFNRYDVVNGTNILDRDRSNRFKYKENINAVYANWNRAYKGVMVQAGLRVENTVSTGTSNGQKWNGTAYQPTESEFNRKYTSLFPSASVTFNKNPMNQWSLTYSRRIDRPSYQSLNPFEFKLDEYTFQKGNINLRPQFTNSFGVTRIYKYRLTTSLNYSHVSDLFTQIIDTAETSKLFISQRNLATQDVFSLNVSYPYQYKAYSVFANLSTNYSMYQADFGAGRKIDANAFGAVFYAQNSVRFAKVWTAEVSGFYSAPTLYQGTFKAKGIWSVDAGVQKQIFGGNGTIKAAVSDVFHTMRIQATSDFAGQLTRFSMRPEAQQFKLNLTWRFGSTTVKGAKQKSSAADDELKRAEQSGGGGIGIGGK